MDAILIGVLGWLALGWCVLVWWTRVRRNQERNEFQRVVLRRDDPAWYDRSYAQGLTAYRWAKAYQAAWIALPGLIAGAWLGSSDTMWRWGGVALSLLVACWWGLRVRRLWHRGLPANDALHGERKVTTAEVLRDA